MEQIVLAVDFDGPIHDQKGGYRRELDGTASDLAKWALTRMRDSGAKIIIHTVRACDRTINGSFGTGEADNVARWLKEHDIPFDEIWTEEGKPYAHAYIDDRGITYCANWEHVIDDLRHLSLL